MEWADLRDARRSALGAAADAWERVAARYAENAGKAITMIADVRASRREGETADVAYCCRSRSSPPPTRTASAPSTGYRPPTGTPRTGSRCTTTSPGSRRRTRSPAHPATGFSQRDGEAAAGPAPNRAGRSGHTPLFLLSFDPTGNGTAAVAIGDPDTAANTAVIVPGVGTEMDDIRGQINRAAQLQDTAAKFGEGSTSVIAWVGYDTPGPGADLSSAPFGGKPAAGARSLDGFVNGLNAAHDDTSSQRSAPYVHQRD